MENMENRHQTIVLASGNQGKLREIQHRLGDRPYQLVTQKSLGIEPAEETGLTFVENAILKARHAAKISGLPALADDSGLSVNPLQGAPGIYSARYSGVEATDEQNNQHLLKQLEPYSEAASTAFFTCVLVFMRHAEDPAPLICQANWHGYIVKSPKGQNGFGYDPLFMIPELNCTSAELTPEKKNEISHRGQALTQFIEQFSALANTYDAQ